MDSTPPGGFVAELRRILSAFFLGDAFDERHERTFEILFRLLGHLARLDGTVSASERELASKLMDDIALPAALRDRALGAYDAATAGSVDIQAEIQRYLDEFPIGSPQLASLHECLTRLAHADGQVDAKEQAFLDELNKTLGIDEYNLQVQALAMMPMH